MAGAKIAILQVADTGPLESIVKMLSVAGYLSYLPSKKLKDQIRGAKCDTVLDIENLVKGMGYSWPDPLPTIDEMDGDIYVDVKAHRNSPKIIQQWPHMKNKILWYRINGGEPEHVRNARGDFGNEIDPGCPILTPNQWYKQDRNAYTCWPPFVRFREYTAHRGTKYSPPICLIHGVNGWGYEDLIEPLRKIGVFFHGVGAPDGLIQHREVKVRLTNALAMVHLKSSDAPGYALYEAMAAGCPIICTRRLIWRCRMQELLIPGQTCLVFDQESHAKLSDQDVRDCLKEVKEHLAALADPIYNAKIGLAGRERLKNIMWDENRIADRESMISFMEAKFPS